MAELIIRPQIIQQNIRNLSGFLQSRGLSWTLIVKILSGDREALEKILDPAHPETTEHLHSIGDSRLTGLKIVKEINPKLQTMYIKPPAIELADEIVQYADISLNTSWKTIQALDKAAGKAGVLHKVLVMIELGELREGILGENLLKFYEKIFALDHVKVIGIGTNLGCLNGVEPTRDKMIQLSLYKQLIEASFQKKVDLVSGGTSITLPLVEQQRIPKGVNHFRIGEAAFMGISPLDQQPFQNLETSAFEFDAHLLEIEEKEGTPDGIIGEGSIGHGPESVQVQELAPGEKSIRALVDFGLIDVDPGDLVCQDPTVQLVGSTSDMTVYDLGENRSRPQTERYQVGQTLRFTPSYMGVARLMGSKFVDLIFE